MKQLKRKKTIALFKQYVKAHTKMLIIEALHNAIVYGDSSLIAKKDK